MTTLSSSSSSKAEITCRLITITLLFYHTTAIYFNKNNFHYKHFRSNGKQTAPTESLARGRKSSVLTFCTFHHLFVISLRTHQSTRLLTHAETEMDRETNTQINLINWSSNKIIKHSWQLSVSYFAVDCSIKQSAFVSLCTFLYKCVYYNLPKTVRFLHVLCSFRCSPTVYPFCCMVIGDPNKNMPVIVFIAM